MKISPNCESNKLWWLLSITIILFHLSLALAAVDRKLDSIKNYEELRNNELLPSTDAYVSMHCYQPKDAHYSMAEFVQWRDKWSSQPMDPQGGKAKDHLRLSPPLTMRIRDKLVLRLIFLHKRCSGT
jgi:hypothetical protein